MPLVNSGTDLWTFADAVRHLLDLHELDSNSGLNKRNARASLLKAYRDLPSRTAWNYYYRQRLLQTVAAYSTGTVAFDYTGGASERMLTLTTGTWPSWAAFGRVIIDDVHYEVATRESNSIITLTETSNPGADVAALTTYQIYRSAYLLPADYRSLCRIWDVEEQRPLNLVDPAQHHTSQQWLGTPQEPWEAMVRATGEYYGGMALHFGPPPETAKTYDLLYIARPRPLNIEDYSTGTVTVSLSSATVTGSGTVFPTNCVGSVIRFSKNSTLPTSVIGGLDGSDNPFLLQGVIKTRTSDTALVLEEAASVAIAAGSAFTISDPLDIEPGVMLTALLRAAEAEFCVRAGRKDSREKLALAQQALLEAMENNTPYENLGYAPMTYDPFTRTTSNE